MSQNNISAISQLNDKPSSVCYLDGSYTTAWSLAQQFAILRLSPTKSPWGPPWDITPLKAGKAETTVYRPIKGSRADKAERARIIAATYARFYLETEEHGNPKFKGRYYWMALGAFASKTVACNLESFALKSSTSLGLDTVADRLSKGNFWLFQDIAATHWLYNYDPETCLTGLEKRGSPLHSLMEHKLTALPWAPESLPVLQKLKLSAYAKNGMRLVREIEKTPPSLKKYREVQLEHLLAIADHEQREVLQKLIYNDAEFVRWLKIQREIDAAADDVIAMPPMPEQDGPLTVAYALKLLMPPMKLVFAAACDSEDKKLESRPDGIKDFKLEDEGKRMKWIGEAANRFHDLMFTRADYMEEQLKIMANWHKPTLNTHQIVLKQHDLWCML